MRRTAKEKIKLFASLFRRLDKAYGTYEPNTGRHWQIKKQVTQETIYNHLSGSSAIRFYPLVGERTHVGVTDFDDSNPEPAIQLVERARHYRIHSYLEIRKSKGYHVWALIDSIGGVGEDTLDWIIQPNDLEKENYKNQDNKTDINTHTVTGYSLPVCIRRMLNEGVTFNQ